MKLLPTGTCFDDALELMAHLSVTRPETRERLVLVHGIAHFTEDGGWLGDQVPGTPFAHGWLELDGEVWQGAILPEPLEGFSGTGEKVYFTQPIAEHYERLRITDTTRYTLREAHDENERTELFGPWVERYQDLCSGVRLRRSA